MAAVAVASPAPAACAGPDPARLTRIFSRNKYSMPVPRNVSTASRGVLTIGWPFTLKLVFNTISRPVVRPTARNSSWNSALSAAATVCTRADRRGNLGPPIGRTQERHRQALVPDVPALRRAPQRRAQCAAVVSRRWLDVDLIEQPRLEQAPVGGAIERHTTRQRQPALARRRPEVTAQVQQSPVETLL